MQDALSTKASLLPPVKGHMAASRNKLPGWRCFFLILVKVLPIAGPFFLKTRREFHDPKTTFCIVKNHVAAYHKVVSF
ncbi:MAG: hypothetical protein ACM3WS_02285 [Bacillota bacterium]